MWIWSLWLKCPCRNNFINTLIWKTSSLEHSPLTKISVPWETNEHVPLSPKLRFQLRFLPKQFRFRFLIYCSEKGNYLIWWSILRLQNKNSDISQNNDCIFHTLHFLSIKSTPKDTMNNPLWSSTTEEKNYTKLTKTWPTSLAALIVETIPWHQIHSPCRCVHLAMVEDQIHSEDPNVPDQQEPYQPSESGAELSRVEHWLLLVKQRGFPGFEWTLSEEIKHQNVSEV